MTTRTEYSDAAARQAHCWFNVDRAVESCGYRPASRHGHRRTAPRRSGARAPPSTAPASTARVASTHPSHPSRPRFPRVAPSLARRARSTLQNRRASSALRPSSQTTRRWMPSALLPRPPRRSTKMRSRGSTRTRTRRSASAIVRRSSFGRRCSCIPRSRHGGPTDSSGPIVADATYFSTPEPGSTRMNAACSTLLIVANALRLLAYEPRRGTR